MRKKEQELISRIKAIHEKSVDRKGNSRRAELEVMLDAFLGPKFNPAKRRAVRAVQARLHKEQGALAEQLTKGKIKPGEYLGAVDKLVAGTFAKCERILGPADFGRLFGVKAKDAAQLIDRKAFLESHRK